MSRIVLDSVTKRYPGGTTAVQSLDLHVDDGELLVLVGPSGCGKTTALRMIAGLNLFVAGFIGSPAMNLVDARLERDEQSSAPAVVFGAHRLPIPPQVVIEHPALARYLGRDIVLGIRPEDMHDAELARDADPPAIIKLPVKLREELGSEVQVHGAIGTAAHVSGAEAEDVRSLATMVARMSPKTTIKEGDVARVLVDTGALHFFDRATGESIRGRRGPGRTTLPSPD
jgi:multiple sugar transport system ATP-binding protein